MSLDIIIARVLDDARAEAERIKAESRRKADDLRSEDRRRAESLAEAFLREAEREAALEAGRIVTQARLERRIELLTARKALVAEVIEQALGKASFRDRVLSKTIVSRSGETVEPFERDKLLDELRPKLENIIAEILKI
jgi:vacuolar-type H+-ATPase subunit H